MGEKEKGKEKKKRGVKGAEETGEPNQDFSTLKKKCLLLPGPDGRNSKPCVDIEFSLIHQPKPYRLQMAKAS